MNRLRQIIQAPGSRLALVLVLMLLIQASSDRLTFDPLWIVTLMAGTILLLWFFLRSRGRRGAVVAHPGGIVPPELRVLAPEELPPTILRMMDVRIGIERGGVRLFRGPLRQPSAVAYRQLKEAFEPQAVPVLQEDEHLGASVALIPRSEEEQHRRPIHPAVHWLLLVATLLTTLYVGAQYQGVDLLKHPGQLAAGLPYSLGLMLILGVHELGHYFTARRHGIYVTPPFFIPVPFALGTFGAFIQMRSPPEDRRSLFDVAVAGPLAGMVIAVPALLLGLRMSQLVPLGSSAPGGTPVQSSILIALLSKASFGQAAQFGQEVQLHALAFAGFLGLFITALNLLPVGQLDGGHTAYAMFGRKIGDIISKVTMWSLVLLGLFVWQQLLVWAIVVFFIAGHHTPPLDDLTPISPGRKALGYFCFALLAAILLPMPHVLWNALHSTSL